MQLFSLPIDEAAFARYRGVPLQHPEAGSWISHRAPPPLSPVPDLARPPPLPARRLTQRVRRGRCAGRCAPIAHPLRTHCAPTAHPLRTHCDPLRTHCAPIVQNWRVPSLLRPTRGEIRPPSMKQHHTRTNLQRPPFLRCRHSRRPRPARPMLFVVVAADADRAALHVRQRPACRMSTSRGSGNGFAAAQAQQSHQQQSASTGTASKQTAALGRPSALSVLQHVL